MKNLSRSCFVIGFFLLTVCAAWASQNEAAIEKTITDATKAMTDFPRTRDLEAVLQFYAQDYTGINDGEWETMEEMKKTFSDLEEKMNLGSPIGISYKVSNIIAHVTGTTGWATYDFSAKIGMAGETLVEEQGKCTGIYIKNGAAWAVLHEHCSSKGEDKTEDVQ